MPTLNIGGQRVKVGDDFLSLSPEQQNSAVEEISRSLPTVAPARQQAEPNHPEFDGSNIPGYNPETGLVEKYGKAGSAGMGAADMAALGWGDELAAGPATLIDKLPGGRGKGYSEILKEIRNNQSDAYEDNPKSYIGGMASAGLGSATAMARNGLSLAANVANRGGSLGRIAAASGVDGGILGLLQGAGTGTDLESRAKGAGVGAGAGMALGAASPYAVSGLSSLLRRAISPLRAAPERVAAAQTLRAEGVNPTAGQVTGSRGLLYSESELGGNKAAQMLDDQGEAFTNAAMRRAGGSGRATPDNMTAVRDRLSQGFDDISGRTTLRVDQGLVDDMNNTMREYLRVLPTEQKVIVSNIAKDIVERFKAGSGSISGKDYQTFRSRLTKRAQNAKGSDNELADAFRGLRDTLDEGMARSASPEDAAKWTQLRREYGNMKILENAATGGGEGAAAGIISPARLRVAATTGNRGGYARGEGDFSDLARAGNAVLTPLPNSGTAGRLKAQNLGALGPMLGGALIGGGAGGYQSGDMTGMLAGAAAGAAIPRVAGRALMTKPVQSYLSNQIAASEMSNEARGLLNALLEQYGSATAGRLPAK